MDLKDIMPKRKVVKGHMLHNFTVDCSPNGNVIEMKNTLVSIYGKSTSKHDNIAIRAIQKDTHRKESFRKMARALVSYGAHSNSLIHVQLQSQNLGVGREDRRKIEKILAEVFPNLVKTTKSGNPKNVKQKKGEENHTTELNCSKPVITR